MVLTFVNYGIKLPTSTGFHAGFRTNHQQYPDGGYNGIPVYQDVFWKGLHFFWQLQGCIPRWLSLTFIGNTLRKHISFQIFFANILGVKLLGKDSDMFSNQKTLSVGR